MKRLLISLVAGLAVLAMLATGARTQTEEKLREEFHQTYPLADGGRVNLENINGSVRITAWDRNEVKVDAVKTAYTRERLQEAKIEISANGNSIYIKTDYPDFDQSFTDDQVRAQGKPRVGRIYADSPQGRAYRFD